MIPSGTRIGPYEVTAQLGAGGMGEVYRARDSRLERIVAIKVLPKRLSSDARLRERFEREAKAISALSHPHICTLYDIGSHDGVDFLVMEYLEGESLADRLGRGPLPLEQVLRYGVEIAQALEKAHRAGIVHRDLKPGNVVITKGGAKLLDFGLAKFAQNASPLSDPNAATAAMVAEKPLTEEGSIVGTLQYMAPEQIEGREADKRTDIFALGAMLYEMATGRRAFEAKSRASLIASILDREPPAISTIQPVTPPALERLVRMCLAKDPDERWQSAHDVAAELKWIADASREMPPSAARQSRTRALLRNAALLLAGLTAGVLAAWLYARNTAPPRQVARVTIPTTAGSPFLRELGGLALSPDGTQLVYRALTAKGAMLMSRSLETGRAVPIAGTEDAHSPVFSPDGRWIAFVAPNQICRVPREGGTRVKIADSPGGALGLSWVGDTIYGTRAFMGGVWEIPLKGGPPRRIIASNPAKQQRAIVWPEMLPGGKTIIATAWNGGAWDEARIFAFNVANGSSKLLIEGGSFARYSPSGHLLFLRGGNLMAVTFDPDTLEVGPNAVSVVDGISHGSSDGEAHYAISKAGHLAYVTGGDLVPLARLLWIDRTGKREPIVPTPRRYGSVALAPDSRSAVVTIESSTYDVWHLDFDRDALTRISHGGDDADVVFTPDGSRVIWTSSRSGNYNLFSRAVDAKGTEEQLLRSDNYQELPVVTPDGTAVVYAESAKAFNLDILMMPFATRKPRPVVASSFNESAPAISPDGRWLAYVSNESGDAEVYVTSFPDAAGRTQISVNGGASPRWMPDGREIVFLKGRQFHVAPVDLAPRPRAGRPRLLSEANYDDEYAVAPDGRLAVIEKEERKTATEISLVLNWFDELQRRVPTR